MKCACRVERLCGSSFLQEGWFSASPGKARLPPISARCWERIFMNTCRRHKRPQVGGVADFTSKPMTWCLNLAGTCDSSPGAPIFAAKCHRESGPMRFAEIRIIAAFSAITLACVLLGCGGSGGSKSSSPANANNTQPVVVNSGPAGNYANGLFTTVPVCLPQPPNCQPLSRFLLAPGSFA